MTNEGDLRRRLDRALRQETALLQLASVDDEAFPDRIRRIIRTDAETLETARVSFWSFRTDPRAIHCDALYIRAVESFETGMVLPEKDFPHYFEALHAGKLIAASDAHTHPSTIEFSTIYLKPNGIGAMLDVPVYVRGRLAGVVCHEHVGAAREWTEDEQLFAMSAGQLVALAIEARRRELVEEALRESEERFRTIVEAAPIPMVVASSPDGTCLYGNQALAELFGKSKLDLVGEKVENYYVNQSDREGLLVLMQRDGRVRGREVQLKRANGEEFWALLSAEHLRFDGKPSTVVGIWDLTRQKELEEILRHAALHDPLTALPNRALFVDLLRNELARAQRDHEYRFAVLYIDLNGFKEVNDVLGHEAGDALLITVGERLRACLRATDTAARIGGDEFTALLVNIKDPAEVAKVVERIDNSLRLSFNKDAHEVVVSASIGTVLADATSLDPDDILRRADGAMYTVKRSNRPAETTSVRARV